MVGKLNLHILKNFSSVGHFNVNRIGVVTFSVLISSAVDRGFEHRLGQTKDNIIGICCFFAKHATFKSKSKIWIDQDQNNVSEWETCVPVYYRFSELELLNPTKRVGQV